METLVVIVLVAFTIVLFFLAWTNKIPNEQLERGANVAGIVTLLSAILVILLPLLQGQEGESNATSNLQTPTLLGEEPSSQPTSVEFTQTPSVTSSATPTSQPTATSTPTTTPTSTPFIADVSTSIPTLQPTPTDVVAPTSTATPTNPNLFSDDFEDGNANGWNPSTPSNWNVVNVNGNYEYTCIGGRTQYGTQEFADYRISADLRSISNRVNMGIIGRFVNGNLFYLANLNGSQAKILIGGNGRFTDLAVVGFTAVPNTIYNVALDMQGTILTMYVNGEQVAQVEDARINSGIFGLRCDDDTQATFDNVIIETE